MTTQQDMKRNRNEAIVAQARAGLSPKQIAARFNLHVTGIHRILRNNGAGRRAAQSVIRG